MKKSSHFCKFSTRTVWVKNHEKARKMKLVNQIWICCISHIYFLFPFTLNLIMTYVRFSHAGCSAKGRTSDKEYFIYADLIHFSGVCFAIKIIRILFLFHTIRLWPYPIIIMVNNDRYVNVSNVHHLIVFREWNDGGYGCEDDLG